MVELSSGVAHARKQDYMDAMMETVWYRYHADLLGVCCMWLIENDGERRTAFVDDD
jgi:hypothetical protein